MCERNCEPASGANIALLWSAEIVERRGYKHLAPLERKPKHLARWSETTSLELRSFALQTLIRR
jgi:hypothetical protein